MGDHDMATFDDADWSEDSCMDECDPGALLANQACSDRYPDHSHASFAHKLRVQILPNDNENRGEFDNGVDFRVGDPNVHVRLLRIHMKPLRILVNLIGTSCLACGSYQQCMSSLIIVWSFRASTLCSLTVTVCQSRSLKLKSYGRKHYASALWVPWSGSNQQTSWISQLCRKPKEQGVILVTEHNAEVNAGFAVLRESNHAPPLLEEDWQSIPLGSGGVPGPCYSQI